MLVFRGDLLISVYSQKRYALNMAVWGTNMKAAERVLQLTWTCSNAANFYVDVHQTRMIPQRHAKIWSEWKLRTTLPHWLSSPVHSALFRNMLAVVWKLRGFASPIWNLCMYLTHITTRRVPKLWEKRGRSIFGVLGKKKFSQNGSFLTFHHFSLSPEIPK